MKVISDEKLQEAIGWSPNYPKEHKAQQEILACPARDIAVCAGRGFGKSAIAAYIGLKKLLIDDQEIAIIAPTYDLTQRVFEYLERWIAKGFPDLLPGISTRTPASITNTPWRSNLYCKSTENPVGILGRRYDLTIIDEVSQIKKNIFNRYIFPTTSAGGGTFKISTPFGKNIFYEQWIEAKKNGGAFRFNSKDNPYFPIEEWDRAKELLPEDVFKQEYEAFFLDDAASVFRGVKEVVNENCLADAITGNFYTMGVDLAKHHDFTVLTVIDSNTKNVVYFDRFTKIDYPFQKKRIIATAQRYNNARIIVDSTGVGQPIKDDLEREGMFVDDFYFTGKSKKELIEKLSIFIQQGSIVIPANEVLIDELESYGYQLTDAGNIKYSAPQGGHADCVISLALAVWGLNPGKPQQQDKLKEEIKKRSNKNKPKSFI